MFYFVLHYETELWVSGCITLVCILILVVVVVNLFRALFKNSTEELNTETHQRQKQLYCFRS